MVSFNEEIYDSISRSGFPVLELRTVASVFNADTLKYLDRVCSGRSLASWPSPWLTLAASAGAGIGPHPGDGFGLHRRPPRPRGCPSR